MSFFASRPESDTLDAWLNLKLAEGTPQGQLLFRSARAAHSFQDDGSGGLALLVGLPVTLGPCGSGGSLAETEWGTSHRELEGGLSHSLGWPTQLARFPLPVARLHEQGPSQWGRLLNAFHTERHRHGARPDFGRTAFEGAGVWLGVVRAPAKERFSLERAFFKQVPELSRHALPVVMRAEALLEEQGVAAKVFPPTAAWNATSLARILYAKGAISRLPPGATVALADCNRRIRVQPEPGNLPELYFPEELPSDLAPLFRGRSGTSAAAP